jgi:hypothetical protein
MCHLILVAVVVAAMSCSASSSLQRCRPERMSQHMMDGCVAPGEGGIRPPPPGMQDGGGATADTCVVNLSHMLGFPLWEGGRKVSIN